MITRHRTLKPATMRFIWLLLALAVTGLIVVAFIAINNNDTATTPPTVITLPPQPAGNPGTTTVQQADHTQAPEPAPTTTAAAPPATVAPEPVPTTVTTPPDQDDPSHSELVEQALATRAAIEQAQQRAAERALLHDATTHDHEPPTDPAPADALQPEPVPEPPPTTTLQPALPTTQPPPPPTTEPAPSPEPPPTTTVPPPEPVPGLKPLPPKPEDTCTGGRTLESYQREDYSTWYCRAVIPEPVGEPRAWPLPPDPDHYTYRNSDPDNVRPSAMTYPIELAVGNTFYGPTGLRGIIVDIVPRPDRDLWGWDWYRVYNCAEARDLSNSWEYGSWAIREPDGRFRIEWSNARPVVPCGYDPDT